MSSFCLVVVLAQIGASPSVRQFELDNGLRVALREDHSAPLISVNLRVRAGSANDEPGRTGLAHLLERLMFTGTRRVPHERMDRLLAGAGGEQISSTFLDSTRYGTTVPSNFLPLALWIEADRLSTLLESMTQEKLDGQLEAVGKERLVDAGDVPHGDLPRSIVEALYPEGHPYRSPIVGSRPDLQAVTLGDARAFFRRFYVPNNMMLVVAGDLPPDARMLVERYFGGLISGPGVQSPVADPVELREEKKLEIRDQVRHERVYFVWPTPPPYAPGDVEMDLLAAVLAGGKSSRLHRRLVHEKRIARDVDAALLPSRLGSSFRIVATAGPGGSAERLAREIDDEIEKLKAKAPAGDEVLRARNRIHRGLLRALEHVSSAANLMSRYDYHWGDADSLDRDLERYRMTTAEDLREAAKMYLGPGRIVLTVLPR